MSAPRRPGEGAGVREEELFWGCFWRCAGWGLRLGARLGAAYGFLAVSLFAAVRELTEGGWAWRLPNAVLAFAANLPVGILGAVVGGLLFGPVVGLALGLLDGFALAVLLRAGARGRAAAWGACLATVAVAVAMMMWYVLHTDPMLPARLHLEDRPTSRGLKAADFAYFAAVILGPAVVAVAGMRWANGRVADYWRARKTGEDERDRLADPVSGSPGAH